MSWEDYHRRHALIDDVLIEASRSGRADVPARWQREIVETFGGQEAFLSALHHRWLTTLTARLDTLLEDRPADPRAAARQVRKQLAMERPALWALLSAHADHLTLARTVEQQRCGWAGTEPAWWAGTAVSPVPAA